MRKISTPTILNVYWWKHPDCQKGNFGDEITPEIIEKLWGINCRWAPIETCDLIGTGSIIEKVVRENTSGHTINVWGSGFMHEGRRPFTKSQYRIFAVRGRLTKRRMLLKNPFVSIGDPGMLANMVYEASDKKLYTIGILPHYADSDNELIAQVRKRSDILVIDPLQRPADVAKAITSCRIVFSSSLHGLIFADSFGVPNYWSPLSSNIHGGNYKFHDYFSSVRRAPQQVSIGTTIDDGKKIETLIRAYRPIQNLAKKQAKLIKSFPYRKPVGQ